MTNNNKRMNLRTVIYIGSLVLVIGISWGGAKVASDSLKEQVKEIKLKQEQKVDKADFIEIKNEFKETHDAVIRMEQQLKHIEKLLEKIN